VVSHREILNPKGQVTHARHETLSRKKQEILEKILPGLKDLPRGANEETCDTFFRGIFVICHRALRG